MRRLLCSFLVLLLLSSSFLVSFDSPLNTALASEESIDVMPHPSDFSGKTLRKLYEPFDYIKAKTSPTSYKNTPVYLSGSVLMYWFYDDGWGYATVSLDDDPEKPVYISLPPTSTGSGIDFGDDVEVYGVFCGKSDSGIGWPLILTTMQLVNHGPYGLYPEITQSDIQNFPATSDPGHSYAITKKSANLRSMPDAKSAKVCSVKQGEKLKLIKENYSQGWHQVSFRDQICFISSNLVSLK